MSDNIVSFTCESTGGYGLWSAHGGQYESTFTDVRFLLMGTGDAYELHVSDDAGRGYVQWVTVPSIEAGEIEAHAYMMDGKAEHYAG